jgi:ubiquitin-protein ligase
MQPPPMSPLTLLSPPQPDTPYSGGVFNLDFQFPQAYPFEPPEIKFLTRVYHPNIRSQTGEICADVFKAVGPIAEGMSAHPTVELGTHAQCEALSNGHQTGIWTPFVREGVVNGPG